MVLSKLLSTPSPFSFFYNPGNYNNSVVTASHAIFVEKDGYRAPVAVVGLQYKSSNLRENFFNITSSVMLYDFFYRMRLITF